MKQCYLWFFLLIAFNLQGQTPITVLGKQRNGNLILFDGKQYALSKDSSSAEFVYDTLIKAKFNGYILAKKDGKYGVIDSNGKNTIPYQYDFIYLSYHKPDGKQDAFIVQKDNRLGVIDKYRVIIPIQYDAITNWVEYGPNGYYIMKDGKFGLIDNNGINVVPLIYDSLSYDTDNVIYCKLNGKCGIVNKAGQTVIPFKYDIILIKGDMSLPDDKYPDSYFVKSKNRWSRLNNLGKIIEKDTPEATIKAIFDPVELGNYAFKYTAHRLILPK